MSGPTDPSLPPQTCASVRRVPGDAHDQRTEDLQRLNLLAQAAHGRARQEATYQRLGAAACDAARRTLAAALGEVSDDLVTGVGDAVLEAILAATGEPPTRSVAVVTRPVVVEGTVAQASSVSGVGPLPAVPGAGYPVQPKGRHRQAAEPRLRNLVNDQDRQAGVVFDGLVSTSYAQMTLVTGWVEPPIPNDAFVGQVNGLCGAIVPGALFLVTGTRTGTIPVRIRLLDAAPELGSWEEIVEASLTPAGPQAAFAGWAADPAVRFDLPAPCYRVRWSATGMDAAHDRVADEANPALDHFELALWPAPPAPDAILRRTSALAAYWHDQGFTRR